MNYYSQKRARKTRLSEGLCLSLRLMLCYYYFAVKLGGTYYNGDDPNVIRKTKVTVINGKGGLQVIYKLLEDIYITFLKGNTNVILLFSTKIHIFCYLMMKEPLRNSTK